MAGHVRAQVLRQSGQHEVIVRAGVLVLMRDTFFVTQTDTAMAPGIPFVIRPDPYARSQSFYDSLATKPDRSRMQRYLLRLFIRRNNPVRVAPVNEMSREDAFDSYEGRTIRSIRTLRIPVLDGNVNDTAFAGATPLGNLLNYHPSTQQRIIRVGALLQEGQRLDATTLADAERLVRELRTIRDARLYVLPVSGTDSVDVLLATQDYFPLRANVKMMAPDNYFMSLADNNVNGAALFAGAELAYKGDQPQSRAYALRLRKENAFGRFARIEALWSDQFGKELQSFGVERNFLSAALPDIGGVKVSRVKDVFSDTLSVSKFIAYTSSCWYGRSFDQPGGWQIIPMVAWDQLQYSRSIALPDGLSFSRLPGDYTGAALYFLKRAFMRTSLVNEFGISEYIPVGWAGRVEAGREWKEDAHRNYGSISFSTSLYRANTGFFGFSATCAAFTASKRTEDRQFSFQANYFSPLLKTGRIRLRHFLEVQSAHQTLFRAFSALPLPDRRWNASETERSGELLNRYSWQTLWHFPWYVYGFRFAAYNGARIHQLFASTKSRSSLYPSLFAGCRVQNDFLLYSVLSLQVEWLPTANGLPPLLTLSFSRLLPLTFRGLDVTKPGLPY